MNAKLYLWQCDDGTYDICEDTGDNETSGPVVHNVPGSTIKAAQELLEALQEIYELRSDVQNIADKLGKRFATSPAVNRYEAAFTQARAAIAKATGGK